MAYQGALCALARYYGTEPTRDAVLATRADRVYDFPAYVQSLFDDANIGVSIVDMGHPLDADLDTFERVTGRPTYGIFRIEVSIWRLWDQHDSLDSYLRAYLDELRNRCSEDRIVSLKSVIAYRTGLAIEPVDRHAASRAFDWLKRSPDSPGLLRRVHVPRDLLGPAKTLRDFLLWQALELSVELDMPFQIHTGIGDQDINIATARPGLLGEIFRDPKLRHAKIVLLHGSYPYYDEGAYLANIFPNVYLDLSLFNPWVGYESIKRVMASILDMAPFTKLLYASDAYGSPEMQWLAGKYGRSALTSALNAAAGGGLLPAGEAETAVRMILAGNARELYGLESARTFAGSTALT
jgi:predicted TIM-barrel fold metal-dependent hydrolase